MGNKKVHYYANNIAALNRYMKDNFIFYMEKNPHYFKEVYGNISIEEAWKQARQARGDYDEDNLLTCEELRERKYRI